MSHDDAQRYLDTMRRQGYTNKYIRQSLQEAGWDKTSIDYLLRGARARPSMLYSPFIATWPVYITVAIIVLIGLAIGGPVLTPPEGETPPDLTIKWHWYDGAIGLFGIVIALGVVLLRPWAWWFGLGFCAIVAARVGAAGPPLDWGELVFYAVLGFCVWGLATRRWLFFPPKPEGEE